MDCPWSERRHVLPTASTRCLVATLFATGLVLWMSVLFAGGSDADPGGFDEQASQPSTESLTKAPPRPEITSDNDDVDASAFSSGDTGGDDGDPLITGRSFALPRDSTGSPGPAHIPTRAMMSTATATLGSRAPPDQQGA